MLTLLINFLGEGITVFMHDKNNTQEIDKCSSDNCYRLNLQYSNPMDQIRAVVSKSQTCKQHINVK